MTKQHAYTHTYILDPQVDTSAYAAGDCITATEYELTSALNEGAGGVIQTITVIDLDSQDAELELIFFGAEPSNTTFTDNAALDVHDTDLDEALGSVVIEATDYKDYADNSLGTKNNLGFCYRIPTSTQGNNSLYVALVARSAATWTNAGNLRLKITVWFD